MPTPEAPFDVEGYSERLRSILAGNRAGNDLGMVRSLLLQAIDLYGREITTLRGQLTAAKGRELNSAQIHTSCHDERDQLQAELTAVREERDRLGAELADLGESASERCDGEWILTRKQIAALRDADLLTRIEATPPKKEPKC